MEQEENPTLSTLDKNVPDDFTVTTEGDCTREMEAHEAMSVVVPSQGFFHSPCMAILTCSAQGLAATPDSGTCPPDGSVLLDLVLLVSGTHSRALRMSHAVLLYGASKGISQ